MIVMGHGILVAVK